MIYLKKRKLKWGVGINDVLESCESPNIQPFYKTWQNLLMRCYNNSFQKGRYAVYKGYSVTPEWHKFSAFKSWMEKQDWRGKELDKDVLGFSTKIYSPETCAFITIYTNRTFRRFERKNRNIKYTLYFGKNKPYTVQLYKFGKRLYFGRYKTLEEAQKVERIEYSKYFIELSEIETDSRVKQKLLEKANEICQEN